MAGTLLFAAVKGAYKVPKLNPKRKRDVLRAALRIARQPGGWSSITRVAIADVAECAESLVSYYYGSMEELRSELMKIAIDREYLDLIVQGLMSPAGSIPHVPAKLRARAVATLSKR